MDLTQLKAEWVLNDNKCKLNFDEWLATELIKARAAIGAQPATEAAGGPSAVQQPQPAIAHVAEQFYAMDGVDGDQIDTVKWFVEIAQRAGVR